MEGQTYEQQLKGKAKRQDNCVALYVRIALLMLGEMEIYNN